MHHTKIVFTKPQQKALSIAVIIALVVGALFLRNYVGLLAVAAIVSFIFYPLYDYILKKTKRKNIAANVTFLISLLVFIIPVFLISAVTIVQLSQIIKDISKISSSTDFNQYFKDFIYQINRLLEQLPGTGITLSAENVTKTLQNNLSTVANTILSALQSSLGSIPRIITQFIIYIYVFVSILLNKDTLVAMLKKLNPMGSDVTALYLKRAGLMTGAMVRGQFIIAVLQGFVGAFFLYVCGVHYFAFFWLILTALSVIPLGGGILIIPFGIINLLIGNYWQGLTLLLSHFLITTNVDNVLRPKMVPKEAKLNSALTILSVFAGIGMFGFIGIIIGPVVMIIIVTTIQVYLKSGQDELPNEVEATT